MPTTEELDAVAEAIYGCTFEQLSGGRTSARTDVLKLAIEAKHAAATESLAWAVTKIGGRRG